MMMSQPQAYLAARDLRRQRCRSLIVNRSHGVDLRVNAILPQWRRRLGIRGGRIPFAQTAPIMRRLLERHWPAVAEHSDGIMVTCHMDRDVLIDRVRIPPGQVRVIPLGLPSHFLDKSAPAFDKVRWRRLLYVGQYSFVRGPDVLYRSLTECCGNFGM